MNLSRYRTSPLEGLVNQQSILVSSPSYPFFRFESTLLSRALRSSYRLQWLQTSCYSTHLHLLLLNVPCTMKDVHFNEAKEFVFVNGRIFLSFKVGSTPFGILLSTTRSFVISFVSYTLTHTRPTRPLCTYKQFLSTISSRIPALSNA